MLCPHCNKEILFIRLCPKCNKKLFYKTEGKLETAIQNNKVCISCAKSGRKYSDEQKASVSKRVSGSGNPMYGKSIYSAWVKKYGKHEADRRMSEYSKKHRARKLSEESKENIRNGVKKYFSDNKQLSLYEHWLKKYGEEIANDKMKARSEKMSKRMSGSGNPMYGKPSPKGSGNGWSGWYKGFYFRSLLELSYLKYLIDNNIKFESAENNKYRIEYIDYTGKKRNYFPDFYLNKTKEIVEIKPKKLVNSKSNIDKFNKAHEIYGDKFIILTENDIIKLNINEILDIYNNKDLKWNKQYEEKFKEIIYARNNMHN